MTTTPSVSSGGGASFEGLSDLLECSVCLEPLDQNHKVLPCQHTFCLNCLEDLATKKKNADGHFLCPECRAVVTTPISALPTNVILNRILSGISSTPTGKSSTSGNHLLKAPPPPPLAIGDHRKLPFPGSLKFDNNNIPGKTRGLLL